MDYSIPTQLHFPASAGFTIRAEFDGGAMSSDFGALLLRGIDLQIGLIPRLVSAAMSAVLMAFKPVVVMAGI